MEEVKYRCKLCGYSEKPNKGDKIKQVIVLTLTFIGMLSICLILITIIYPKSTALYLAGTYEILQTNDKAIDPSQFEYDLKFNVISKMYASEMRPVTLNITRGCEGNRKCYLDNIYNYMNNFNYIFPEKGKIYTPQKIIKEKAGDCKWLSTTFCSLMISVGQDCLIISSEKHSKVITQTQNNIYEVDLTVPYIKILQNSTWFLENKK